METIEIPVKPTEALLEKLKDLFDAGWMYPEPEKVEAEWAQKAYDLIVEEARNHRLPHVAVMKILVPSTLVGGAANNRQAAWTVKVMTSQGHYADAPGFAGELFLDVNVATTLAKELGRVYGLPSFTLDRMKGHDIVSR